MEGDLCLDVEAISWCGGQWKSLKVRLFPRIGPKIFSSERGRSLLSRQIDDFSVLLEWLRDNPERKFDVAFWRRGGFLNIQGASKEGCRR